MNVDASSGLDFAPSASPALSKVIREESINIQSPAMPNVTLDQSWDNQTEYIGSGSDYTPFFHHLGVSVIDFTFNGKKGAYGGYHSIFDNNKYVTLVDPNFSAAYALSMMLGSVMLRLSFDDILVFNLAEQTEVLQKYYNKLPKTKEFRQILSKVQGEDLYNLVNQMNDLQEAIWTYSNATVTFDAAMKAFLLNGQSQKNYFPQTRVFNDKMMNVERMFLDEKGLNGRPFFKHVICAPHIEDGYGYEVFPGIMEALRSQNVNDISKAFQVVSEKIVSAAVSLN